jgi:hypothetical protein
VLLSCNDDDNNSSSSVSLLCAVSNHDGLSNGLTAPNTTAQIRLLKTAKIAISEREEKMIVIECHGTGTVLGDRVEAQSISESLSFSGGPLLATACKSQLGHAEAASGLLSLLRVLVLEKEAPKLLHFRELSNSIGVDLMEKMNCVVPLETVPLPTETVIGVNSFGMSGTNVHVIVKRRSKPILATNALLNFARCGVASWASSSLTAWCESSYITTGSISKCCWSLGEMPLSTVVFGCVPKKMIELSSLVLADRQVQLVSVMCSFSGSQISLFKALFSLSSLSHFRGLVSSAQAVQIGDAVEAQLKRWGVSVTRQLASVVLFTARVERFRNPRHESVLYAFGRRRGQTPHCSAVCFALLSPQSASKWNQNDAFIISRLKNESVVVFSSTKLSRAARLVSVTIRDLLSLDAGPNLETPLSELGADSLTGAALLARLQAEVLPGRAEFPSSLGDAGNAPRMIVEFIEEHWPEEKQEDDRLEDQTNVVAKVGKEEKANLDWHGGTGSSTAKRQVLDPRIITDKAKRKVKYEMMKVKCGLFIEVITMEPENDERDETLLFLLPYNTLVTFLVGFMVTRKKKTFFFQTNFFFNFFLCMNRNIFLGGFAWCRFTTLARVARSFPSLPLRRFLTLLLWRLKFSIWFLFLVSV